MKNTNNKLSSIVLLTACLGGLSDSANAVDGVILITQANAMAGNVTPNDDPGFPVTISRSGSYKLASNLQATDVTKHVISIITNNVSLDLNGFSIIGLNAHPQLGGGDGIIANENARIAISNGTIYGMGGVGVRIAGTARIENLTISHNQNYGILCFGACIISGNTVDNTQGDGISVGDGSIVTGNTVANNTRSGISASGNGQEGVLVIGNTVIRNGSYGLFLSEFAMGYTNNVFTGNNNSGYQVNKTGGTQLGSNNLCNNQLC